MNAPRTAPTVELESEPVDVFRYHQRTKHSLQAYARGPDTIDWELQPDPFRKYDGAVLIRLPLVGQGGEAIAESVGTIDLNTLLAPDLNTLSAIDLNTLTAPDNPAPQTPGLASLGILLQFSLALSAWKQYGSSRWSLRCNPSSGNLHPSEAYLVVLGVEGLADGVYHYRADLHGLELRCQFSGGPEVEAPQVLLGFSSLHWRESWKYGERAYRYCQLDIGHAMASASYAAALVGWTLMPKPISGESLAKLLGLDRQQDFILDEEESPDCLFQLVTGNDDTAQSNTIDTEALVAAALSSDWQGIATVIDRRHFYRWPLVAAISEITLPPEATEKPVVRSKVLAPALRGEYLESLVEIIPHRRSAQAFDGRTEISREQFFVMLDHLLPRPYLAPWHSLAAEPALHCVLFVHRVRGLSPGLYALPRTPAGEKLMRAEMRDEFAWEPVVGAPPHLHLYSLVKAKAERSAATLSCQQAIAADGVFSLAMLAEFRDSLENSPWRYPELYREAGVMGQVLYLEAEGIGLQGTGIGCFFDDAVHELLGIEGDRLQTLYHFTVGSAVRDPRIVSYAPYGERREGDA